MPAAFCPNPQIYDLSQANGALEIKIQVGWDGVSTPPNCTGPMQGATVRNDTNDTYEVSLPFRRNRTITVTIAPHSTQTYTAAQLSAVGIDTPDDIAGLLFVKV